MKIVFLGTPEFAVPSLKSLVGAGYNIVGVITAPDRPKGRGKKMAESAVKEYAVSEGLRVMQPTNLKSPEFLKELSALNADLQVVVAFRMLPEVVWNMPPLGTFNLHASLLPNYRGAAPINWAIINGETETGVTTFFLKHEIDTGNVLFQENEKIHANDTAGTLYSRLMLKGAELVLQTVKAIENGNVHETDQVFDPKLHHSAPKIHKETCKINWQTDAHTIINFVRGLSPYPAAWTKFENKLYKIFKVRIPEDEQRSIGPPGTVKTDNVSYIHVQTGDFVISIMELQPEGKKRMNVSDFLRGNRI